MGAVVGGQPEAPPALAPHLLVRINEILPLLVLCLEDTGPFVPGLGVLLLPHSPSGLLVSAHSGHTQKPLPSHTGPPRPCWLPKTPVFHLFFNKPPVLTSSSTAHRRLNCLGFGVPWDKLYFLWLTIWPDLGQAAGSMGWEQGPVGWA